MSYKYFLYLSFITLKQVKEPQLYMYNVYDLEMNQIQPQIMCYYTVAESKLIII